MRFQELKTDQLFLRYAPVEVGHYNMPLIRKQALGLPATIHLIAANETKARESKKRCAYGVHHFVSDDRLRSLYTHPNRVLRRYAQYAFVLTPDYSVYGDMPLWRQIESVAHSRWCGAYWQSKGLKVITTITWGLSNSFNFCFDGVESGSIVAISTVGTRLAKVSFMEGYREMMRRIHPSAILCIDQPYPEMFGNIITIAYPTWKGCA